MSPKLHAFDPDGSPRAWAVEEAPTWQQASGALNIRYTADAVYRFYDADRRLLYIGMTGGTPYMRWADHRRSAPWWRLVAYVSIDWIRDGSAASVEKAAIRAERPPFNKAHNTPRVRMELRLDRGPDAIVEQIRTILMPEDFAALVAAFAAQVVPLADI